MLFNSIEYAFFLPIVFLIYWAIGYAKIGDTLKLRAQNAFVVIASYVFYGWWDWRFLLLIAFTSLCSYASGLLIIRGNQKNYKKNIFSPKVWLWLNIAINIGILAIFKYYDFFVSEFGAMFGISTESLLLRVILPVGISFYTFQALSYSIDVYRGNIKPTKDIVAFFAFIAFFPQLVAGPIERATNLLPQFLQNRRFSYEQATDGMRQILWGLFKKIVIADNCALYVDQVWAGCDSQTGSTLLLAAILFTFQIYGDFSGYSDIAIGTAKLFGIKLMRNFNNPYLSRDIAEFWRRWHISLTTWFRDYVYIPLGGSRPTIADCWFIGKSKKQEKIPKNSENASWKKWVIVRNTFIIFLVSGIWHGANWTFLAWGAYHAVLFLPLILTGRNRQYTNTIAEGRRWPTWREMLQVVLTFAMVAIGWVIFRAESITQAWEYIAGMCQSSLFGLPTIFDAKHFLPIPIVIVVLIVTEYLNRAKAHGLAIEALPVWQQRTILLGIIALLFLFGNQPQTFIYFQF